MLIGVSFKGSFLDELLLPVLTSMDPPLTYSVPVLVFEETLTDLEPDEIYIQSEFSKKDPGIAFCHIVASKISNTPTFYPTQFISNINGSSNTVVYH